MENIQKNLMSQIPEKLFAKEQTNKWTNEWINEKTLNSKAPVAEAEVQQLNETCYKWIHWLKWHQMSSWDTC